MHAYYFYLKKTVFSSQRICNPFLCIRFDAWLLNNVARFTRPNILDGVSSE